MTESTLHRGQFLTLTRREHWEFCQRNTGPDVVAIIATTTASELVLTEQHRIPLGVPVIELPAGLVGDEPDFADESLVQGAIRELEEETGYAAGKAWIMGKGPTSAGLTTEMVHLVRATELTRVSDGGGDSTENITPHIVPLSDIDSWLGERAAKDQLIDPKIYAALYWISRESAR